MSAQVADLPLSALFGAFLVAAVSIWVAANRLVHNVDAFAERTGIGQAFAGMLLLGGITSLPEAAAVTTSAALGNASLAVNNLIGTASINLLLLALADAVYGAGALTRAAARPATLMQGVLSMLLAILVAMLAAAGDVAIAGVGVGAVLLVAATLAALAISSDFEQRHVWEIAGEAPGNGRPAAQGRHQGRSVRRPALVIAACAAAILIAGSTLSFSADAIAQRTGIESGMTGFLLVGAATSLPEASSVIAAVRRGRYELAVGDVFGTNLFNFLLIFLADLVYRGAPVLDEAGTFETVGAALAAWLTGLYMIGLLERHDRTVLRMGQDTVAVLLSFAAALFVLASLAG